MTENSGSDGPLISNVIKSENDDREYRYLVLPNQMKILLISDPKTEKSAASLDVHVGYASDPESVAGIAHFCEHMLFLGTEKYPEEDEFNKFLSQNGGYTNAFTCGEFTNYHFDVKSEAFASTLDRFAQFFISPLFDSSATDRELNAIESEHQKNILNDYWRENYINRMTSKPGHAYGTFGIGNLETLKTVPTEQNIDIRELLLEFHSKYYSANIMGLAVLGKESLDDLEKMCTPLFMNVPNKKVTVTSYDVYPYGEEELGVIVKIPTIMEMKSLQMKFMIPDTHEHYRTKPWDYVTHLIGHEGKGSLLSLLKQKVWVNSLYAGTEDGLKGFDFFSITMSLTDEGMNFIYDIIDICFQYIKLMKNERPKEWIFNETKNLTEINFRFKNKREPQSYVTGLSNSMQFYPPEDVLYGGYRMDSFKPELITEYLELLNPSNFRCTVQSQIYKGKTDRVAKYYDADYSLEKMPFEQIKKWKNLELHPELNLPKENLFIPESLDVVVSKEDKEEKNVPVIVKENELMRIWYKADDRFFLPKSSLKIRISSPYSNMSPSHENHISMFSQLIEDELCEFAYDAELAGISYCVDYEENGLAIDFSGFNNKQIVLLKKILHYVIKLEVKKDRFNVNKVELLDNLKNSDLHEPYQQIGELKGYLMLERNWSSEDRLSVMDDLTEDSLRIFMKDFLMHIYVECLFCGNLLDDDVNKLSDAIESSLMMENKAQAMLPMQHNLSREYKLKKNTPYLFEKKSTIHSNSCVYIYLQVGLQTERSNVLCELVSQMTESSFFDILRTKEQLGYIVSSGVSRSDSVQGFKALIQTDKPPSVVCEKIDQYFENFTDTLVSMTDKEFKDYVDALAVNKLKKPKKLNEETQNYWDEISCYQFHFRRSKSEVDVLRTLAKSDVIEFYKKFILPSSEHRRNVTIVVLGKDAQSMTVENKNYEVVDLLKFKNSLALYPNVQPYNDVTIISSKKEKQL